MMRVKVVGLAGTIASGKEAVKQAIMQRYDCYQVSLSQALRGEVEKKKGTWDRRTMQDVGDELRRRYGGFVLAKVSTEFMSRDKPYLIVDGIRNPAEAEWLKKAYRGDFVLVGVDAPQQVRWERVQKRARPIDPKTFEEFVQMDERDQGKDQPPYGQQVRKCLEMADVVVENDGDQAKLDASLQDLYAKMG